MWELDHKKKLSTEQLRFLNWVLEKTLESSLKTTRRSNQSIIKEISPEYSLEGLMLNLQYFGHRMRRTDSLEKTLVLRKIEGRRRRGQQRIRWLEGIPDSKDINFELALWVGDGQGSLACCSPWGHKESHMTEWLNWTELELLYYFWLFLYSKIF